MLHIDLKGKYYLEEQLDDIVDAFNQNGVHLDKDTVRKIASGCIVVRGIDELLPVGTDTSNIANVLPEDNGELKDDEGFIGAYAIDYLFRITNTEHPLIEAFTAIDLGTDIFYECNSYIWYDITTLAARVQNRINRLTRMIELDAPMIIIINEYRMAYECFNTFAENGWNNTQTCTRCDGRAIRSISDIGYSLYNGWSPEMKQYFAEKEAEFEKEQEEMEAAARGENND